jgi:signal transduction histidine kinase
MMARFPFWTAAALLASIGLVTLGLAIADLGKPFPGFLLTDRYVLNVGAAAQAGLRPTDRILAIDGQPVTSDDAVVAYSRGAPVGTRIRYEVDRVDLSDRHTRLTLSVPTHRLDLQNWLLPAFMMTLIGMVYLVLGAVVSIVRPGVPVARAHLAFSWAAAFSYMTAYLQAIAHWPPAWLSALGALTLGWSLVALSLLLPRRIGGARHPWLQAFNAATWTGLAAWTLWALSADRFRLVTAFGPWGLASASGFVLLGNLVWTAVSPRSTDTERAQGTIVAGGIALGVLGGLAPELGGLLHLPFWTYLPATVLMLGAPVGIAAAIVYQRLFAIEVPFRRSLTYGLLAAALATLYVIVVGVVGGVGALGGTPGLHQVAGTLAVAVAIIPLRDAIRKWLDRAFFRTPYDPLAVVARFSELSHQAADPDALADALSDVLAESLAPEWAVVERPGAAPAEGATLRVPLGQAPSGVPSLALGPRKSELPYSAADRDLLRGLSEHFGLWLDIHRHVDAVRSREAERDAARQSEAMQRAFLGMVSHELRTPLSTITLTADLIAGSGPPGGSEPVALIQRAAVSLTRFVGDLLDAAQIEAGVFRLQTEEADLAEIAREAAGELRQLAALEDQDLRLEIPPGGLRIQADRQRLLQVLRNLLHNACKFTPNGGWIRLAIRAEGEMALAEVADSGPGMSPEEALRAFTRFGRGDRLARTGAGLGLYIAKELVEAHGGAIALAGNPGQGAVFTVSLPLAGSAPQAAQPTVDEDPAIVSSHV